MSVLTKSGQNQACKMQFQSVVCSVVQVWVQVWPYGTTSGEASTHFFPFCDFHLATTLFSFFLFFGSQGTLYYGERLYLHKLIEINFACLVGILDRNSQMTALA